jgi:UDP-2,3-diacylglucosamine hydrolase
MADRLIRDRVLFVSDVHLTPADPETFLLFCRFLTEEAVGAKSLYLLGDVFDFWVGRKQITVPGYAEVFRRIRDLAGSGTEVFFMAGNRDYMLDAGFAGAHGMKLLPDRAEAIVGTKRVLLTHGDLLVTKDKAYQRMRKVIRSDPARRLLAALPLTTALRLAGGFRTASGAEIRRKPAYVLDPDFEEARTWLGDGFDALVFGHVHRGEQYHLWIDGRRADIFILGAWEDAPSFVEWDGRALVLRPYAPGAR